MAREYLRKNIWRDKEGTNYVMLDVTDHVPTLQPITINGIMLYPKDEYHVTLVPTSQLTEDGSEIEVIIDDLRRYLSSSAVEFVDIGEEYYHCQKDDEQTVIVSANVVGLDGLHQVIASRYPDYAPAFAHITLYKSQNSKYGIGVSSYAQLRERCRRISCPTNTVAI